MNKSSLLNAMGAALALILYGAALAGLWGRVRGRWQSPGVMG